jgi:hypothetical protein
MNAAPLYLRSLAELLPQCTQLPILICLQNTNVHQHEIKVS